MSSAKNKTSGTWFTSQHNQHNKACLGRMPWHFKYTKTTTLSLGANTKGLVLVFYQPVNTLRERERERESRASVCHTYILTMYIHAYIHAHFMYVCMNVHIHTYYVHTCEHTYMHNIIYNLLAALYIYNLLGRACAPERVGSALNMLPTSQFKALLAASSGVVRLCSQHIASLSAPERGGSALSMLLVSQFKVLCACALNCLSLSALFLTFCVSSLSNILSH